MNKLLGIILVVLGLLLSILPNYTDCASHGVYMTVMGKQLPMVCHWSARAEMVVGIPLIFVGVIMTFTHSKTGFLTLSVLGLVLGVLAITLPLYIIGTCSGPTMTCNTVMKPIILWFGSLVVLGGLGGFFLMRRAKS